MVATGVMYRADNNMWKLLKSPKVEIRFLIYQDKMSRQVKFWLDISKIWLDKFSGPSMT